MTNKKYRRGEVRIIALDKTRDKNQNCPDKSCKYYNTYFEQNCSFWLDNTKCVKDFVNLEWYNIRDKVPPKDIPVLFKEMFSDDYHVGYWSEYENCMMQFPEADGYHWSVRKWKYIEPLKKLRK